MELKPRELQVLRLATEGNTEAEIAQKLYLGRSTVHTYRARIRKKLGAKNMTHAVAIAFRLGVVNAFSSWKCHICGEERPNEKISVLSKPLVINGQVVPDGQQNIRYCNDRPGCIEEAKEFIFFKDG